MTTGSAAFQVIVERVAQALADARVLIARNGLAYDCWFTPYGPDVDVSACPMDPMCAIAVAVTGEPHGLAEDDWRLDEGCVMCAIIAAAAVAFATHVMVTENLIDEEQPPPKLTAHDAMELLIAWLEADLPPVRDVVEAFDATAADLRRTGALS